MITGEMKNKVDSLWTMFWTGGLTNPLDVIEQIESPVPKDLLAEFRGASGTKSGVLKGLGGCLSELVGEK
jgi:hypothetical protein